MDNLTKEQRRRNMSNIRSKGTTPENMMFREMKCRKIYFSKHVALLAGKPDLVFRRKKVAVFIDSDFWHGHPDRFIMPKSNVSYWKNKIARNRRRDAEVNGLLRMEGWRVIRIWEHNIMRDPRKCVTKILRVLKKGIRN